MFWSKKINSLIEELKLEKEREDAFFTTETYISEGQVVVVGNKKYVAVDNELKTIEEVGSLGGKLKPLGLCKPEEVFYLCCKVSKKEDLEYNKRFNPKFHTFTVETREGGIYTGSLPPNVMVEVFEELQGEN